MNQEKRRARAKRKARHNRIVRVERKLWAKAEKLGKHKEKE